MPAEQTGYIVDFWDERDRASVVVYQDENRDKTIAEWWDEQVYEMVEDGWFKFNDKDSVIAYCKSLGLLPAAHTEMKEERVEAITLYKWTNFQAVDGWDQKQGFSTTGVMGFNFVGEVEEPKEYLLPEGYALAKSNMGTVEIYDTNDRHCDIEAYRGKPCIRVGGDRIYLRISNDGNAVGTVTITE